MDFFERFNALKRKVDKVYIYGAGLFGTNIYRDILRHGGSVDGFVVTQKGEQDRVQGLYVNEINDVLDGNIGIVIGVNRRNEVAVRKHLEKLGVSEERIINGNDLMDDEGNRGGYDDAPIIEITTKIGCSVNCRYCPQHNLIKQYFKSDPYRSKLLTVDLLERCLDHIPQNTRIRFCGMAEPFLNPSCMDFIRLVFKRGYTADLFTTLEGLKESDVDELVEFPFSWVNIHLPDIYNYAKITVDEKYFRVLQKIMSAKRDDLESFVSVISAQAEIDSRVKTICGEKFRIFDALTNRAGNLDDTELLHNECKTGAISCSLCGNNLNNNILLPDGSLVLCCMDYGLRHILGNLSVDLYEDIMSGNEVNKIRHCMEHDDKKDVLCRHCSYAQPLMN